MRRGRGNWSRLAAKAAGVLCVAGTMTAGSIAGAAERATAIVAGRVLQPDGSWRAEAGVVRLDASGRISAVADASERDPDGAHVYRDGFLTPGLIELASRIGLGGGASEQTSPDQMDLRAIDAFDPHDRDAAAAVRAGVTAAMIIPEPRAPLAGRAGVVRTAPSSDGSADVLRADSAALFSVAPAAMNPLFGPTSRAGAMAMVRGSIERANAGQGDAFVRSSLRDGVRCVIFGQSADDVFTALGPFERAGITPTVALREEALEFAFALEDEIRTMGLRLIAGPFGLSDRAEVLAGPGAVASFGGVVGLAGTTSADDPDALRRGAAMAVRYGLDAAAARRAMTSDAARIAGVEDRVGSIERGRAGDMVVWTHDPLRPDARVIAVYIDGVRVYHAAQDASRPGARIDGWDDRPGRRR